MADTTHDWAQMIRELEAAGFTLAKLSEETGLHASSLSDIKQGRTKGDKASGYVVLHRLHTALADKAA